MVLDKKKREAISKAQKIVDSIGKKLKENNEKTDKIDMTKLAKELSDRREKAKEESDNE